MARIITADLHNHSTASDGEYTPFELVARAKELGLKAVGITDHDNIEGLDEALKAGKQLGIQVIPGVEVSVAFKRPYFVGTLHILFYFSNDILNNTAFRQELMEILSQGRGLELVKTRVKAINIEFGPQGKNTLLREPLTIEQITNYSSNVTRRHFALALKEKHGITERTQITNIIGNDSSAYIPSGIDIGLLPSFVKKYNILKVLAHPAAGSFPEESLYREVLPPVETVEKILPEFLELNLNGIEVHYPGHIAEHRELLIEWAKKYNLIISGGSDCHDLDRPLGIDGLTQEEFKVFLDNLHYTATDHSIKK